MRAFVFAILIGLAAPASAADPAAQLVETMQTERALASVFRDLGPLFGAQVVAQLEREEATRATIQEITTKGRGGRERLEQILAETFLAEMRKSFPEIKAELAAAYREKLTTAELEELNRFFSSGVGAKYVGLEPVFEAKLKSVGESVGMKVGMAVLPRAMERVEAEMMK